jgi:hypothetical protein
LFICIGRYAPARVGVGVGLLLRFRISVHENSCTAILVLQNTIDFSKNDKKCCNISSGKSKEHGTKLQIVTADIQPLWAVLTLN